MRFVCAYHRLPYSPQKRGRRWFSGNRHVASGVYAIPFSENGIGTKRKITQWYRYAKSVNTKRDRIVAISLGKRGGQIKCAIFRRMKNACEPRLVLTLGERNRQSRYFPGFVVLQRRATYPIGYSTMLSFKIKNDTLAEQSAKKLDQTFFSLVNSYESNCG